MDEIQRMADKIAIYELEDNTESKIIQLRYFNWTLDTIFSDHILMNKTLSSDRYCNILLQKTTSSC